MKERLKHQQRINGLLFVPLLFPYKKQAYLVWRDMGQNVCSMAPSGIWLMRKPACWVLPICWNLFTTGGNPSGSLQARHSWWRRSGLQKCDVYRASLCDTLYCGFHYCVSIHKNTEKNLRNFPLLRKYTIQKKKKITLIFLSVQLFELY